MPGGTTQFGATGFWFQEPKTWNISAKMSKNLGRHYLKTGGEYRDQRIVASRPRPMSFSFSPGMTADTFINPNTRLRGDSWATFLLGAIDDSSRITSIPLQKPRVEFFALFLLIRRRMWIVLCSGEWWHRGRELTAGSFSTARA